MDRFAAMLILLGALVVRSLVAAGCSNDFESSLRVPCFISLKFDMAEVMYWS